MPEIKNTCLGGAAALVIALAAAPASAWEPSKPVEIVVAAGAGGSVRPDGADDAGRDSEEQPVEAADGGLAQGWLQLGSKPVSVVMLLQVIALPSHMACAQGPT